MKLFLKYYDSSQDSAHHLHVLLKAIFLVPSNFVSDYGSLRSTLVRITRLCSSTTRNSQFIDGLNSVGNYRRNIDGTKHIIFSTFLLSCTDRIPTENYRRKFSVGNFRAVCKRQLLGTIYRQNTYGKLPTEVFRR